MDQSEEFLEDLMLFFSRGKLDDFLRGVESGMGLDNRLGCSLEGCYLLRVGHRDFLRLCLGRSGGAIKSGQMFFQMLLVLMLYNI